MNPSGTPLPTWTHSREVQQPSSTGGLSSGPSTGWRGPIYKEVITEVMSKGRTTCPAQRRGQMSPTWASEAPCSSVGDSPPTAALFPPPSGRPVCMIPEKLFTERVWRSGSTRHCSQHSCMTAPPFKEGLAARQWGPSAGGLWGSAPSGWASAAEQHLSTALAYARGKRGSKGWAIWASSGAPDGQYSVQSLRLDSLKLDQPNLLVKTLPLTSSVFFPFPPQALIPQKHLVPRTLASRKHEL